MSTIVTRAGKGSALTHNEVDANFTNLNTDKVEKTGTDPVVISVNSSGDALRITQTGTGNALVVEDSTNPDSTPLVIDRNGKLLIGFTADFASPLDRPLGVAYGAGAGIGAYRFTANSVAPVIVLSKSRSATIGTNTIVQANDSLGTISGYGADGTNYIEAASIEIQVDGTPGTNDMPGRLVFGTTADGASTPTERMRIGSSGNVGIGRIAEAGYQLDIANPDTTASAKTLVRVSSSAASGDGDAELIIDAKGNGEASLRVREDGLERGYLASFGDTDVLQITNVTVDSDLMFMGASTTSNDTYSLRYQRASGVAPVTGITGTITSSANTSTITGLSTTTGLVIGMVLTKTAGTGVLGTQACIQSIDSASQITVTNGFAALTAGSITFTATPNPTTITAMSASGGTWAAGQDFARFAFGNLDASGTGDGGIRASINAYTYDTAGTGAGMDFYVSSDGTTLTKAARINEIGDFLVGTANPGPATSNVVGHSLEFEGTAEFSRTGSNPVDINRLEDGGLVLFRSAGTAEGNISISGTTTSYNGGHLSRWAQMLTKPDLLKGTVMSNLDEMNVYIDADGNTVENEQLNKVKVSDVEGDANVAGVFVNWTHDDAHNVDEINMAMTGDMIIRIAQGVTVQRGDLLMSAGDGTAKSQGDDIVRSKTIAKVTSTHVTCTYKDGSYCVPCVLMAC
jgi:hypothetical protein